MKRVLVLLAAAAAVAVLAGFTTGPQATRGTVYIGMDAPLTGPQAIVGQGDREAVIALVGSGTAGRPSRTRLIQVDILDNASNPSQAVQNVQRFVADSKYVAILGSGNAAAAVATAPLATAGQIPFLRSRHRRRSSCRLVPYVYVALPTVAAVRLQHGSVPEEPEHPRIALMGDNGGFGRDGVAQVKALARAYGFTITDEFIFSPTSTSFAAELTV